MAKLGKRTRAAREAFAGKEDISVEEAVALIKEGKDIDYDGASGTAEFDENGDVGGYIGKFVVDGDGYKQIAIIE